MVVIVTKKDEDKLGTFVSFIFSLFLGLFLISKRNSFSRIRIPNFQILKRTPISALSLFACLLIWSRDNIITDFCI